jgi:hypothetical protein
MNGVGDRTIINRKILSFGWDEEGEEGKRVQHAWEERTREKKYVMRRVAMKQWVVRVHKIQLNQVRSCGRTVLYQRV